jgi:hypothetical protein
MGRSLSELTNPAQPIPRNRRKGFPGRKARPILAARIAMPRYVLEFRNAIKKTRHDSKFHSAVNARRIVARTKSAAMLR